MFKGPVLSTGKRPKLDQTKTGKNQKKSRPDKTKTRKNCKKTGLY